MEEIMKQLGMTILYMMPVFLLVMLWIGMSQSNGVLNGIVVSYFYGLTG